MMPGQVIIQTPAGGTQNQFTVGGLASGATNPGKGKKPPIPGPTAPVTPTAYASQFAVTNPFFIRAAKAVTQSDTTDDPAGYFEGVWVAVAGDLKVTLQGGDVVTYKACPGGLFLSRIVRVWNTGTTAIVTLGVR